MLLVIARLPCHQHKHQQRRKFYLHLALRFLSYRKITAQINLKLRIDE